MSLIFHIAFVLIASGRMSFGIIHEWTKCSSGTLFNKYMFSWVSLTLALSCMVLMFVKHL